MVQYKEYYHANGKLRTRIPYVSGVKDGTEVVYYENGNLQYERQYKNGLLDGVSREYENNGKISSEIPYKSGKKHGVQKEYFNGHLYRTITYKDGRENGLRVRYHDNGKVWGETYYKDDIRHGPKKVYDENGHIEREENYTEGKLDGIYREYYPNGKVKLESHYINDQKQGYDKEYHESGAIKFEYDLTHGVVKEYNKFGQLMNEKNLVIKKKQMLDVYNEHKKTFDNLAFVISMFLCWVSLYLGAGWFLAYVVCFLIVLHTITTVTKMCDGEEAVIGGLAIISYPATIYWLVGIFTDLVPLGTSGFLLFPFVLWNVAIDIVFICKKFE